MKSTYHALTDSLPTTRRSALQARFVNWDAMPRCRSASGPVGEAAVLCSAIVTGGQRDGLQPPWAAWPSRTHNARQRATVDTIGAIRRVCIVARERWPMLGSWTGLQRDSANLHPEIRSNKRLSEWSCAWTEVQPTCIEATARSGEGSSVALVTAMIMLGGLPAHRTWS